MMRCLKPVRVISTYEWALIRSLSMLPHQAAYLHWIVEDDISMYRAASKQHTKSLSLPELPRW